MDYLRMGGVIIVAPLVWWLSNAAMLSFVLLIWGASSDSYFTYIISYYLGSTIGAWLAYEAAQKIKPNIPSKFVYPVIIISAILLLGLSISAADVENRGYVIISLCASLTGILFSWAKE